MHFPCLLQMCRTHTKNKYYSQKQALEWIMQIAAGLKYLHTLRPRVIRPTIPISVLTKDLTSAWRCLSCEETQQHLSNLLQSVCSLSTAWCMDNPL